jgi:uncharacterized MAPEG superfamily protein
MTIDLACLLGLALWTLVVNHAPVIGRLKTLGVAWGVGNREETPIGAPWIGRADRAQRNHHDNLPMLATVILLAHVTGKHDGMTAVASAVMLAARMGHSVVYILGITALRPWCYLLSLVAMLAIVRRIIF